ncbi:MAG: DUF2207 domain-containing protein [Lewinella sp.]
MRCIILFFLLEFTLSLPGQERFADWQTEIRPQTDRSVEITETLTVVSEADQVKRGITRSLPDSRRYPLRIMSVERDGRQESYHVREADRVNTLYAGQKDVLLQPGTYVYRIRYRIGNAVTRQDDLDELQVEIVGPNVSLPVTGAGVVVDLPADLQLTQRTCYTGRNREADRNCTMTAPDSGRVSFTATGNLGNGEQLSVALGFAPGFFDEPGEESEFSNESAGPVPWWQGEGSVLLILLGALGILWYGYQSWRKFGVDPAKPHVGRVYSAPDGLTPAATGYLHSTFETNTAATYTATILYLATRGYLRIEEEEDAGVFSTDYTYCLRATEDPPPISALAPEQLLVYEELFANGPEVRLEEKYDKRFREIAKKHGERVKETYQDRRSIKTNGWRILPLVGIFMLALIPAILLVKMDTTGYALPALVVYLVFGGVGMFLYAWLIRKPSAELVSVRAELDALREYLGLSEEKRKRLLNAPGMDKKHYEDLLPYAIALGINTKWSDYFGDLLSQEHYNPVWMSGAGAFQAHRFNDNFNRVVGTSSTPPGTSSSASAGGGSVGGGVGGGGAGGW